MFSRDARTKQADAGTEAKMTIVNLEMVVELSITVPLPPSSPSLPTEMTDAKIQKMS